VNISFKAGPPAVKENPAHGSRSWTEDDIMLITTGGMVNRTHVREIRVVGRNTQGVRVMNLNEGDKIASLAKVASEEGEGPPEAAPGADGAAPQA
jgi:DNA gyrase/topoisomerase IV subunit A